MTELDESAFAPLDDFPLLWRWTSPRYDLLAPAVLATIRPLRPDVAQELEPSATAWCSDRRTVEMEMTICAEGDEQESVRARLVALGIDPRTRIVLSWSADTAAATVWSTFLAHWDAFCYPSSDDVTIWAPGEEWVLCYQHFEIFQFSRSRTLSNEG